MTSSTASRVQIIVVGGRLGAGKTSAIRGMLARVDAFSTGVLVNEAASGGVDQFTLKSPGFRLADLFGCMCCRSTEDTVSALMHMKAATSEHPLECVIIETSGLASTDLLVADLLVDYRFLIHFEIRAVVSVINGAMDVEPGGRAGDDRLQQTDVVLVTQLDTIAAHAALSRAQAVKRRYSDDAGGPCVVLGHSGIGGLLSAIDAVPRRAPEERLRLAVERAETRPAGSEGHGVETRYLESSVTFDFMQCLEFGQALSMFGCDLYRFKMLCADRSGAGTLLLNLTSGKVQGVERLNASPAGSTRLFFIAPAPVASSIEAFIKAQFNEAE